MTRPERLTDFVGQRALMDQLGVMIASAMVRDKPLDHLLFAGPPGLGKTTLARIIANEMNASVHVTSGPSLGKADDLTALLVKLRPSDVLFIDEIHRLSNSVEEHLYPAMEDYKVDLIVGERGETKAIRFPLPKFTLVGATTRLGLISAPLRDRFGEVFRLEYYSSDELATIVSNVASSLDVAVMPAGAAEIGKRSRGTPRIAIRLLKRVRDVALVLHSGVITAEIAAQALDLFGVDKLGLNRVDRKLLVAMAKHYDGGPVGISTLAVSVAEPIETIEASHEPYLIRQGLLKRTPQGRELTAAARSHLSTMKVGKQ